MAWVFLGLCLAALFASMYFFPSATAGGFILLGFGVLLGRLVWTRPELGLLVQVFCTSGFLPRTTVEVPLPGGRLDMGDLALISTLAVVVIQSWRRKELVVPRWALSGPLLVFLSLVAFSVLYAALYQGVALNIALNEGRALIYYVAFFATVLALRKTRQLRLLLVGLFLLADLTATAVVLQQFAGSSRVLLAGMGNSTVWTGWQVLPEGASGAVRVTAPGHPLMFVVSALSFALLLTPRRSGTVRAGLALQFVFTNVALFLSYTRAQWIASAIALLLVCLLLPADAKVRLARYLLVAAAALVPVWLLLGSDLQDLIANSSAAEALVSRAASVFTPEETLDTYSLEWRVFETEEALRAISDHPLLGVGLGNTYRELTLLQGEALSIGDTGRRYNRYVHNAYLYTAVKLGIPALMVLVWFFGSFLVLAWQTYHMSHSEDLRFIVLSVGASFVGILQWALTSPLFMESQRTPALFIFLGIVGAINVRLHYAYRTHVSAPALVSQTLRNSAFPTSV